VKYAAAAFDCILLGIALFIPNPLWNDPFPPQMVPRDPSLIFLFVLVAAHALSYSSRLMLWTAAIAALVWSAGVARLAMLPDTLGWLGAVQGRELPQAERVNYILDARFVDLGAHAVELIVFLVASGALALVVRRSQHLVARQVWLERARTNLARYFSPNLVDELCTSQNPMGKVRQQEIAVLFADVSGFTRICEGTAPDEVIDLLRGFFRRAERALFAHGGTLDKYIGDCVMATFGVPKQQFSFCGSRVVGVRRIDSGRVGGLSRWRRT
jgi:adenylate cyclase